jgi:ferritin-like metal-binding protein YciE
MASDRENLAAWLKDAHAMERATIDNITRLLDRMEDHPEFCTRFRTHLTDSRAQLKRLEDALKRLDEDTSALKDVTMRATGWLQALTTAAADDEPVKHCLMAYGYENFEIASYLSLAAAAAACGESEIREMCEQSLAEERDVARWLEGYIPQITASHLAGEGQPAYRAGDKGRPAHTH